MSRWAKRARPAPWCHASRLRWCRWVLRGLVAAVFLWAGITKAYWGAAGPTTVYSAVIPPASLAHWSVVGGEIALGLWLLTGWREAMAATLAAMVLSGFSAVIVVELFRPAPRPCGCGVPPSRIATVAAVRRSLGVALGRNLAAITAAGVVFAFAQPGRRRPGAAARVCESVPVLPGPD